MASKKTKQMIEIMAPKVFGDVEIGRTFANDPTNVVGRRVIANAMNLTESNKYYMKLIFRVSSVNGTKAMTEFNGTELLREYISRMVLRRVRRIDLVQNLETKDGTKVRVKSILVVSKKMSTSTKFDIAAAVKEFVRDAVESSTLEQFIDDLINDEIKMHVLENARKIYPVRYFEIRKSEIVTPASSEPKRQSG